MNRTIALGLLLTLTACAKAEAPSSTSTDQRKTITEATLSLVTSDLPTLETKLLGLVDSTGGFIEGADRSGAAASGRTATFILRVPSSTLVKTTEALAALGTLTHLHTQTQDVTAEYTDTEARVLAKRTEEQRLLRLLETGTGGIQDVLAVEKELARVRTESEELVGRSKRLGARVAMASLTLTVAEQPQLLGDSAFSAQLTSALVGSWRVLTSTARVLAIALTAAAPWLAVLALLVAPWALRARRRNAQG